MTKDVVDLLSSDEEGLSAPAPAPAVQNSLQQRPWPSGRPITVAEEVAAACGARIDDAATEKMACTPVAKTTALLAAQPIIVLDDTPIGRALATPTRSDNDSGPLARVAWNILKNGSLGAAVDSSSPIPVQQPLPKRALDEPTTRSEREPRLTQAEREVRAEKRLRLSDDAFNNDLDSPPRPGLQASPRADAACVVDLLSSQSSLETEPCRRRKGNGISYLDNPDSDSDSVDDGADTGGLLLPPSPLVHEIRSGNTQQRGLLDDQVSMGRAQMARAAHRKTPLDVLELSNSSSPPRPAGSTAFQRSISDKGLGAGRIAPCRPPKGRDNLQRSLSEGHSLAFEDDDDNDDDWDANDDFGSIDTLLAAWRNDSGSKSRSRAMSKGKRVSLREESENTSTGSGQLRPRAPRATASSTAITAAEKEAQKQQREAAREAKRREKEAEREKHQREKEVNKERRRIAAEIAKEKKAQERAEAAAFNQANRSRIDKAVASPEMIVQLPPTLPQASREITMSLLDEIKATFETGTTCPPPVENVVLWRRKVTAEYKVDLGHWVPVPQRIEPEKYALVVLRADELVQLILVGSSQCAAAADEGALSLDEHVRTVRRSFPDHRVVYLVEGLSTWRSKNRSLRNRQFAAAVRNATTNGADGGASGSGTARPSEQLERRHAQRPRKAQAQHVDETVVENALLALQVTHDGLLLHETSSPLDTAKWIKTFTEQIATAPYRRQKEEEMYTEGAAFCMDSGQIRCGGGGTAESAEEVAAETYTLMLQQIGQLAEPVALGVAARFNSLPKLVAGLAAEGPLALEACLRSRNRNGELSDRAVGPALSRRIYKVFMGDDPSTDV